MDNKEYSLKKDYKDSRFKFMLTSTGPNKNNVTETNIICERYFFMNDFDPKKIDAFEIKNSIDRIVNLINEDLVSKSRIHLWYYEDTKYLEEEEDAKKSLTEEPYFTFTFFVDNKPFISRQWSAECYQQFIRNNVDLTNRRFRFDSSDSTNMDYVNQILKKMTVNRQYFLYKLTNGREIETFYPLKSKRIYEYSVHNSDVKIYLDRDITSEEPNCSERLKKVVTSLDSMLSLVDTHDIKYLVRSGTVFKQELIPVIINIISDSMNSYSKKNKNSYSCSVI